MGVATGGEVKAAKPPKSSCAAGVGAEGVGAAANAEKSPKSSCVPPTTAAVVDDNVVDNDDDIVVGAAAACCEDAGACVGACVGAVAAKGAKVKSPKPSSSSAGVRKRAL